MDSLIQKKRIIYIIFAVAAAAFIFYAFYRPATKTAPPKETRSTDITGRVKNISGEITPSSPGTPDETKSEEEVKKELEDKLVRLTDFPVISPSLNKEGNKILFYKKEGGDLISSDFNGKNQEKVSNITILNLWRAVWSPLRDRAVILYLDRENIKSFIQKGTSSISVLPLDSRDFAWSADGKNLAYLQRRNQVVDIILTDALGKNARTIFSTPLLDAKLSWPTVNKLSLETPPSGLVKGTIFTLSLSGGPLIKIKEELFGLTSRWSPDGSLLLLSHTDSAGKNITLTVSNAKGEEVFATNLPTFPDKCAWLNSTEIYCAVPRNLSADLILPDDYLIGQVNTKDQILLINAKAKTIYAVFNEPLFDISDMLIAPKQDYLFFVNRTDGALWSLKIL